ncbi:MAG TPA: 50S ribosomal protein L11 methyltransferase [Vicinamibacterales bacterium]|nr:50S ribosomal protein L11 methyltransferase [Vicinamibacterales bacterium]
MIRTYAALRITFFEAPDDDQLDLLSAELDSFSPTAINEIPRGIVAFFGSPASRDAALAHLESFELVDVVPEDVPDEQWAERSQAALTPVTVGAITVAPPWSIDDHRRAHPAATLIVIQPSMGFGTGHHASTRLCLELLQHVPLQGARVLDVGTGSGVLAIAARLLGAAEVLGVDVDPDALANAHENLQLNPPAAGVTFETFDLASAEGHSATPYDLILANLTGAMLMREAPRLAALAAAHARLIISGFQADESPAVLRAFEGWTVAEQREEATWVGALLAR